MHLKEFDFSVNVLSRDLKIIINRYFHGSKTLLSNLLPYPPSRRTQSGLLKQIKEYKLLVTALKLSLQSFLDRDYRALDSLVGENSCLIRACMLHSINSADSTILERSKEIKRVENILSIDIQEIEKFTPIQAPTLHDYLELRHLNLEISQVEEFLISSYILTLVKTAPTVDPTDLTSKIVKYEKTVSNNIKILGQVGTSFSNELVKKIRRLISQISVQFVQDIASTLLTDCSEIISFVSENNCINHGYTNLKCLPCFWYTYVLMLYTRVMKVPLLVDYSILDESQKFKKVDHLAVYFSSQNGSFAPSPPPTNPGSHISIQAVCVRSNITKSDLTTINSKFLSHEIDDLILACAAAHRQYPNADFDANMLGKDHELFKCYSLKSKHLGCSLSAPKLFFLRHAHWRFS